MKPTFQKASEDLKQTSILHHQHAADERILFFACFLLLNSDTRAVEFFIRDKYEKKKYYSEKVTNGSSVCGNSFIVKLGDSCKIDWFCFVSSAKRR